MGNLKIDTVAFKPNDAMRWMQSVLILPDKINRRGSIATLAFFLEI
ncbi:hypothetical protein [Sphingobacterium griseoflavum]